MLMIWITRFLLFLSLGSIVSSTDGFLFGHKALGTVKRLSAAIQQLGDFILTTNLSSIPTYDTVSNVAMTTLDRITLSSLGVVGASSIRIDMGGNQSLHALEFQGTGKGIPMVLLHGISSCASDYFPLIRTLQPHCSRVIAIDLPGHGYTVVNANMTLSELESSMISCVQTCLTKLGIKSCVLIGNSLGGFVAARFSSKDRGRSVKNLILISPAGAPMTTEDLQDTKKLFNMNSIRDSINFLDRVLGKPYRLPFGIRHIAGWACRMRSRRPSVQRIFQEATISLSLNKDEVARIRCPTLIIWGENEQVFGPSQYKWFDENFPRNRLTICRPPGLGHVPHLDASSVTDTILSFLS